MRSECSDGEDEMNCSSIVTPPGEVWLGTIKKDAEFKIAFI